MTVRDASQSSDSIALSYSASGVGPGHPYRVRDVALPDGTLHVAEWGPPDGVPVLAVHGMTATHRAFGAVTPLLPAHRVIAPDLRGRGRSNRLQGPAGVARHADDLAAVLDDAGLDRALAVGHGLGADVVLALAQRHSGRVSNLLLLDGGLPISAPDSLDAEDLTQVLLGPASARLRRTFPDRAAYYAFWRAQPAFAHCWTPQLQACLDDDLEPLPGPRGVAYRSSGRASLVADDARDLHDVARVRAALEGLTHPALLLRAPRGPLDQDGGLFAEDEFTRWTQEVLLLSGRTVPDVNHYTLLFAPRGVTAVADAIRADAPADRAAG